MKKTLMLKLVLIFIVGGLSYAGVPAQKLAMHQRQSVWSEAGIDYVTGGVGIPERKAMETIQEMYSLKCVFAKENGSYLSGLRVKILDESDKTLVNTVIDGPWILADLPPGEYVIAASHDGNTKTRRVFVNGNGLNVLRYYWK